MKEVPKEWMELLDWMCEVGSHPNPPTCLPIAVKDWYHSTLPEERSAADEALMHWLITWEWPEMNDRVQGLVHLRMSFALYGMVQALTGGREPLRGDAQKRGTIHGLVFRGWERHQTDWLDHYSTNWPSMRAMISGMGN